MNPFALLEDALSREGVPARPELAALVPQQRYCDSLEPAAVWIASVWNSKNGKTGRLFYCTDAVAKRLRTNSAHLDDALPPLLQHHCGRLPTRLDLSAMTGEAQGALHASAKHMPALRAALTGLMPEDLVLVAGSGTATDLVKHALFLEQSPASFAVLPTALTVTAFTSAFSVLDEAGAKRTRPSRKLDFVAWVGDVLAAAPVAMTRAGYGDLLARFVAMGDWYLSYELKLMDGYDERAYRLMEAFAPLLRADAAGFAASEPTSSLIERSAAALSMAGIAMSVSGQTTPLSGFEHVISHALDFLHLSSGADMPYHGEQVALASLSSAMAFDWLLQHDVLAPQRPLLLADSEATAVIERMLKQAPIPPLAQEAHAAALAEFSREFAKKNSAWKGPGQDALRDVQKRWSEVRAKLRSLVMPAAEMERLLLASGLPVSPESTSPATTALEYRWAVRFAPFVRARPSLADALFFWGEDPAIICAC